MQKRNWFLMMFAFAIGIFVFPALSVQADSYKISHYHAQVDIQKNGDAVLTQRVTYNFSGSFMEYIIIKNLRAMPLFQI
nr:hypothetical protein [Liquorilactobacillus satsumensis]